MAAVGTELLVPFSHDLECPNCRTKLSIVVVARVTHATSRVGGTDGLGHPLSVPVELATKPVKLIISDHECDIVEKKN